MSKANSRKKGREWEKEIGAWLRSHGWVVDDIPRGIVKRVPDGRGGWRYTSTPVDLFGEIDVSAMHRTMGIFQIQATAAAGEVAAKKRSLAALPWANTRYLRGAVFEPGHRLDPVNRRRFIRAARAHVLIPSCGWLIAEQRFDQPPTTLLSVAAQVTPRFAAVLAGANGMAWQPLQDEETPA